MAITLYGSKQNIIQVVQTVFSSTFTATPASAFTDITGLSLNITPSSASNKIIIAYNVHVNSGGLDGIPVLLARNGTPIALGDLNGSRRQATTLSGSVVTDGSQGVSSMIYLDSPATTSSITYKLQAFCASSGGATFYVNRTATFSNNDRGYSSSVISTITAYEVAYS